MRAINKILKKGLKYIVNIIGALDRKFLSSRLDSLFSKWAFDKCDKLPSVNYEFLREGKPVDDDLFGTIRYSLNTYMSTRDLLFLQYSSPYVDSNFVRYDIPYASLNANEIIDNGEIILDQDLQIIRGIDKFVILLNNKQEFSSVRVNYIDEWDKKKVFGLYDVHYCEDYDERIQNECKNELKSMLEANQYPLVLILWPSCKDVWGNIEDDLDKIHSNGFHIVDSKVLNFTKKELSGFMDACYLYAGISSGILKGKKKVVIDSRENETDSYPTKLIQFCIDNPFYGVDSKTGQPLSNYQKDLKMNIRSRYWNRIPNYGYDNIIHGTDNYIQSKLLIELSKVDTNISELYSRLNESQCVYTIIKRTKEIRPEIDDPIINNKIIFNSDIDILTTDENIQNVLDIVKDFANRHFEGDWISIEEERVHFNHGEKYNRFLWVRLRDFNVVLFHIQTRLYGLTPQFLSECINNRRMDNLQYVVDMPEYEVYIRLADLLEHPEKTHHRDYVQTYRKLITDSGLSKAFGKQKLKEIKRRIRKILG